MRIISGRYKGKTLKALDNLDIRPTTDRTKEAVFNILQGKICGASILDLFCGSGALGIECISRGASDVIFCDIEEHSIKTTKDNLKNIDGNFRIFKEDYKNALKKLGQEKFDIIFLDPPYKNGYESEVLNLIEVYDILADDGIIILERDENTEYNLPYKFAVTDTRQYAKSCIDVIEQKTKAIVTGSFDPFTKGHMFLVEEALSKYNIVYVVIFINPSKESYYTLKNRLEFVAIATSKYKKRLIIDSYDGYVTEYCKKLGITNIIRGYRNECDLQYEIQMAEYNKANGNCNTQILKSDNEISSAAVRELVLKNERDNLNELVDNKIVEKLFKLRKTY